MTFNDLLKDLDVIAPFHLAQSWDRVGAMTGRGSQEVRKVLVSLDASPGALHLAIESGCQAWVTHHPLIWDPLKSIADTNDSDPTSKSRLKLLLKCVEAGMAVASCHTNWDAAEGGVNDALAGALNLNVTERFGPGVTEERLKMAVTLPADCLDVVIEAASDAGAGEIGLYDQCSFSWPGTGTFLPLPGSDPTAGEIGQLSREPEIRLEMVLPARIKAKVEAAVRAVHPYEEPAFDWLVCQSETIGQLGVIAETTSPHDFEDFCLHLQTSLQSPLRIYGRPDSLIERVALVGGAGGGFWPQARGLSQLLITGEVRQSDALEAAESGYCLIEAGHYATEQPGMRAMTDALNQRGWDAELYVPLPGDSGRPYSMQLA